MLWSLDPDLRTEFNEESKVRDYDQEGAGDMDLLFVVHHLVTVHQDRLKEMWVNLFESKDKTSVH